MENPNKVPNLYLLENKYGFAMAGRPDDQKAQDAYILMGLPEPVRGPAFEKLGPDCVGTYAAKALKYDSIPTGTVHLLVWDTIKAFNSGEQPVAVLDLPGLTYPNDITRKA